MRRTHVEPGALDGLGPGSVLSLSKDASHHLQRVLRLPVGAPVELFDGAGTVAQGRLLDGAPARVELLEVRAAVRELPPLVVAQALVRGPKLEEVVRRSTELGASAVWLFEARRSVVDAERMRADRLLRIAREAARQCERVDLPELVGPLSFERLLEEVRGFTGVAAMGVVGAEQPLSRVLANDERAGAGGALVVVGPEGGLDPDEVRQLAEAGALPARLGPHVLRTETAGLVGLAGALAALGRL